MSFEDKINQAKDSIKEGLEKITGDENIELENVVSKVKESNGFFYRETLRPRLKV